MEDEISKDYLSSSRDAMCSRDERETEVEVQRILFLMSALA